MIHYLKIVPFLILLFLGIYCQPKKPIEQSSNSIKWLKADSVIALNIVIDSFWYSRNNLDSNKILQNFEKCYDSLDKFTDNKNFSKATKTQYYNRFYSVLLNTVNKDNAFFLLEKKAKFLKYLIWLNRKYNNNELVIKYYNELNSESLKKYLPDSQKLQRLHDVGNTYNELGENQKTALIYKETLELAKKLKSDNDIARVTVNFNKLISSMGLYDSIINLSNAIINKDIDKVLKASLCQSLANAYIEKNDFSKSIVYNSMGYNILISLDSITKKKTYDYNLRLGNTFATQAYIYNKNGNINKVAANYASAISLLQNYQNGNTRVFAKLLIETGNFKKINPSSTLPLTPLQYYNKALQALQPNVNYTDSLQHPDTAKLEPENVYFEALDAKANYLLPNALATNNFNLLKTILNYYKISFKVEKLLLNNFIYDNAKIDFIEESKKRTANALQICYILYNNTKQQDWLNAAFQFIENNKATVLLDRIKKNKAFSQVLANDNRINELNVINKKIEVLKSDSIETTNEEFKKAIAFKANLEFELQKAYPQLNSNYQFAENVNIVTTQQFLKTNTAIVDYFYFDTTLLYLYISKNEVYLKKQIIAENEIANFQNTCANLVLQQNNPDVFFRASNSLYKNIFPSTIASNINEIIIIPDGALNNICFEALTPNTANSYNANNFLVHKYAFSYCYSYASIIEKNEFNEVQNKILICTPASQQKINNQAILTNTIDEANAIKQRFNNSKWLNDTEATKRNFLNTNTKFNILHLATHSTADTIDGNSYIDFVDGPLNANSFYSNNAIKPNLVFLSACATSKGKLTNSEGVLSMARSLYYAGAQNVIASQWNVNDKSSAQLVDLFYKEIKKTKYSNSLQKAKLQYLQNAAADKKMPFYWAPFIHIGYQKDYKAANNYWAWALGAFLIIGISFILVKNKKRTSINT